MKIYRNILPLLVISGLAVAGFAQVESGGGVRKRSERDRKKAEAEAGPKITERMQGFYEAREPHDADLEYMRQIYRQIDLTKDAASATTSSRRDRVRIRSM